ncbi:MAG: DUF1343 domain-containing protein, partial [Desulfobacterales bacterium]
TQPFELCGAPFFDNAKILATVGGDGIPGVIFRSTAFEPTSSKWCGVRCNGFQMHITAPHEYRPYRTTLKLLQAVLRHHRDAFEWKPPPYEYEYTKWPIDLIIGDGALRRRLENLEALEDIEASWQAGLHQFKEVSRSFHLYQ